MNAKYMAVFAVAIMLAGCTVLLVDAGSADVDADDTASKTVYVLKGQTAKLKISTTESALGNYDNDVTWSVSNSSSEPTSIYSGETTIATVYVGGTGGGEYILNFKGENVGTVSNKEITYTVNTEIDTSDDSTLEQKIIYSIDIHVLPSSFKAALTALSDSKAHANNHEAVDGGIGVTYSSDDVTSFNMGEYYFYATGLPTGLAMNTDGKIYGTPDIDDGEFITNPTKEYTVTIVATHIASNIAITTSVKLVVAGSPYSFSYVVNGAVEVIDGVYKVIRGQDFNVVTDIGKGDGDHESLDKVIAIGTNEGKTEQIVVNPNPDREGVYIFKDETLGTGSYTIQMINGDQQKSIRVIVIEPLADVDASIGFIPGISHWYDSTE